jgi:hypothetical protein
MPAWLVAFFIPLARMLLDLYFERLDERDKAKKEGAPDAASRSDVDRARELDAGLPPPRPPG